MRHRRRGRKLGRSPAHQRALLRNLAASLFLTVEPDDLADNSPKVNGRIVTTLPKAKEVRPLVEKCITIARSTLKDQEEADRLATTAARNTEVWRQWRESEQWHQWAAAVAPVVAARRRALQLLGNKRAVHLLFRDVAPRFADRPGGYTRVLRLAKPRLGDAGTRAILELVGVRDRVVQRAPKPAFDQAPKSDDAQGEPVAAASGAAGQ